MNKNHRRENSNFNSKPFSVMKSIKVMVMSIFFSVFLIATISAFEFDNIKSYNEETKTIEIRNSILGIPFLQLDKVAEVQLNTPLNFKVPRGYQKVAEFEIRSFQDYSNALKELELYDKMNDSNKFTRKFDYKYKTYVNVSINDYSNIFVGKNPNGTNIYETQVIGSHNELRENWIKFNSSNLKKNDILTIGIFTEVKKGDRVEWIPNMFGIRIEEWAEWTESLNADLIFYYKMDEPSGSTTFDSLGLHNGTITGAIVNQTGIINRSYNFTSSGVDRVVTDDFFMPNGSASRTVNFWVNPNDVIDNHHYFAYGNMAAGEYFALRPQNSGKLTFMGNAADADSNYTVQIGVWQMFTVTYNTTHIKVYANSTIVLDTSIALNTQAICSSCVATSGTDRFSLALFTGASSLGYVGGMDEFSAWNRTLNGAEITQLYNDGAAITFTDQFGAKITLNSPVNSFSTLNATIDFNGTVVGFSNNISNVSLIINDTIVETNSSGINNTDYLFTSTLPIGTHTWTYQACDILNQCGNATVRTFEVSEFEENLVTFNASTFETESETFTINITTNGTAPTSASLIYDGTEFTDATITSLGGDDYNLSRNIDIPLINGNISFNFNFSLGSTEFATLDNFQIVNLTTFAFCETGVEPVYINFTFTNETVAEEAITAEIDTTWNFWLGSGSVKDSLTFSNTTENPNYQFCLTSGNNRTLNTEVNLSYDNSISQLRRFSQTFSLTNITTTQNLFLLPTVDGIFVTFQVVDPAEQVISGVISNVTKNGDIISSGITDDAGLITYFLDPDTSYVFNFAKVGFTTVTITLIPTQTSFTIIMGTVTTINQFDTTVGIDYIITPTNLTLVNGTDVNFSLDLISTFFTLEEFGFVLRNSTGTVFNSTSSTTGTGGLLSQILNTGDNTNIIMEVFWTITGNQTNVTRIWLVFNLENEGFSVLTFFNDLSIYLTSGLFGLDDFGLGIIIFLIILISTGIVSVKFGITSPPGISIVVFSLVAFFDVALGIMPNPINAIPNFPTIFVGLIFLGTLYSEAIR